MKHYEKSNQCKLSAPIVFYDGECPLCSVEINHYRRLDRGDNIHWVDITQQPELLEKHNLTREQAMQQLHVLDQDHQWMTGSYGFALMWSHLPGYRWLSLLIYRLRLLRFLEPLYQRFARWRIKRISTQDT